jgi:putative phosphoesterase
LKKIGLISDTHGYLDDAVFRHFESCDEVWHAGDFGSMELVEKLEAFRPLRGVFGNIDGQEARNRFPEILRWDCEEVPVLMVHIGGYPVRYTKVAKAAMKDRSARLFITGHSHILKVMFDPAFDCLHMNPGAAGLQGWHKVRTLLRFSIDVKEIRDCEVIELAGRW